MGCNSNFPRARWRAPGPKGRPTLPLLIPGIYFYNVKINGESYVHKMIVE